MLGEDKKQEKEENTSGQVNEEGPMGSNQGSVLKTV